LLQTEELLLDLRELRVDVLRRRELAAERGELLPVLGLSDEVAQHLRTQLLVLLRAGLRERVRGRGVSALRLREQLVHRRLRDRLAPDRRRDRRGQRLRATTAVRAAVDVPAARSEEHKSELHSTVGFFC